MSRKSFAILSLCCLVLAFGAVTEGAQRSNPANNGTPWIGNPSEVGSDTCPPTALITATPFTDSGDTCPANNSVGGWGGAGLCALPAGPAFYQGEDLVYGFTVSAVNPNSLTFDLPTFVGDLVLAIFSVCNDPNTCVINSADSIGSGVGPETIGPMSFPLGSTHFLYIDSYYAENTTNSCGTYTLNVTGTLPAELVDFSVE